MGVRSRKDAFLLMFPREPAFRWRQIERAILDGSVLGWEGMTTLAKGMREELSKNVSWMSLRKVAVLKSRRGDTEKAVLECADGARIETVLMQNARGHWSVCVSSQVGCAMGCTFCATGSMGFGRNLTTDEIVDQFRFWQYHLACNSEVSVSEVGASSLISNVVFMGMGEPLANYESVRAAIRTLLENTSLGSTRITVSTVGLLPMMRTLLNDPLWLPVRLAVSLHSADPVTRKRLMPSSFDSFLDDLVVWTQDYFSLHDERRRHLTFEYILLDGVNDSSNDADRLIAFSQRVGKVKINLIPYNRTASKHRESASDNVDRFLTQLKRSGVVATVRKAMGDDIAAACGQLASNEKFKIQNVK